MDNEKVILILRRVRLAGLPLFGAISCWSAVALLGDPYSVQVPKPARRGLSQAPIEYKSQAPLNDYLGVLESREMFRPSVLYETKKPEVVNVLGDLSFLGVVRNGDTVQALIMNTKSMQSSFYVPGQALEDLVIQDIEESKIVFRHGEETLELIR